MNKYKFFGVVAAGGVFLTCFGAMKKIMHQPSADLLLQIGLITEGIGLAALVWFAFEKVSKKNN